MDPARFDRLTRRLATQALTRRRAFTAGAAALAGLTGLDRGTRAQDASPVATPAGAGALAPHASTLFVQTATGGTFLPNPLAGQPLPPPDIATPIAGVTPDGSPPAGVATPVAGTHGDYLLTLTGHSGETIYFSDRPEREFGEAKTSSFLQTMGFTSANPPNAALVVDSPDGEDDVLLLELFNATFDEATQTLTYEANILQNYAGEQLKPMAAQQQDQQLPEQFGSASLFIDDCSNRWIMCVPTGKWWPYAAPIVENADMCWNYSVCMPCEPYGHTQPSRCATWDYWNARCNAEMGWLCEDQTCYADNDYPFAHIGCN